MMTPGDLVLILLAYAFAGLAGTFAAYDAWPAAIVCGLLAAVYTWRACRSPLRRER